MTFSFPIAARAAALALTLSILQACGGGGSGGDPNAITVTAATADRLSYGRISKFTVSGGNLSSVVNLTATGCDNLITQPGGTAGSQSFTCTPNKALSVRVAASVAGVELYNVTLPVPKPRVTLTTTLGAIVVELDPAKVAATVDNFLAYVNSGFYNGTLFHRVMPNFVSQGGGYTAVAGGTLTEQTGLRAAIALETDKGLSNLRGTIAMARTAQPDTATSQFYFNQANNPALDYAPAVGSTPASPGFAVFGNIVTGLSVIDAMNTVATRTVGGFANVPVTNIVLQTAVQSQ